MLLTESLCCPNCKSADLKASQNHLGCKQCGSAFPVHADVPLLLKPELVADYPQRLSAAIGLNPAAVREAFLASAIYGYERPGLSAEFSNIRGRFPSVFEKPASPTEDLQLSAISNMAAPVLERDKLTSRSIRFRNGPTLLHSTGPNPHHVSYHLYRGDEEVVFDGERSIFPVPFLPGTELTVPVTIKAPEAPGRYRFELFVVQEWIGWSEPLMTCEIEVVDHLSPPYAPGLTHGWTYEEDFSSSVDFFNSALALHDQPKVIELACGLYPLSASANVEKIEKHYACDLCYSELILSSHHHQNKKLQFICADVDDLPFKNCYFDLVVICAALHHFPDPIRTLKKLADLLKIGGHIVLVREPCFIDVRAEGYVRDLLFGFNEQVFLPEEYAFFFERAGFKSFSGRVDFGGSLKVIIEKS
jgi:uncharacterized protein YbaR (Trm112 family)